MKTAVLFLMLRALSFGQDWSKPIHLDSETITLDRDSTVFTGSTIINSCIRSNGHKLIFQVAYTSTPTFLNGTIHFFGFQRGMLTTDTGDWRWLYSRMKLVESDELQPCEGERRLRMAFMKRWLTMLAYLGIHPVEIQ